MNESLLKETWKILPYHLDAQKNPLLCDPSEYPYAPETLSKLIDREATIRTEWQSHIRDAAASLKEKTLKGSDKYSTHQPCRYMASEALPSIIEGVIALLNKLDTGLATKDKQNIMLLSRLPWLQFCAIAFTATIDSAIRRMNVSTVIERIAGACETEARWEHYAEREKAFYDRIINQQHKSGQNTGHIDTVLKIAMNRKAEGKYTDINGEHTKDPALVWQNWPRGAKSFSYWLGAVYLDIICAQTGYFVMLNDGYTAKNRGTYKRLVTTKAFDNYITETENKIGLYGGYYLPLPVPPRDWTTTQCGGFWTKYVGQKKLVKNWNRGYQEELLNMTEQFSDTVFPAINAAQHTAWRINTRIYAVLETLVQSKKAIAGLPAQDDPELPVCSVCGKPIKEKEGHPCFIDPLTEEKNKLAVTLKASGMKAKDIKEAVETKYGPNKNTALRMWKMAAHTVYTERQKLKSLRLSLRLGLEVANIIAGDERFYYVYQTDFRGRLYPLGILNPQGADWQKGIIEFADGVELGEHGAKWLAIHLANTYGNDKAAYTDRIKWVHDNEAIILACAANPLDVLDWTEADEPFCFLAACIEWAGYKREGCAYKSHIAIALDGSCSGIQHYSAMLRDETGAIATNVKCLDPDAPKHDIYAEVAQAANDLMTKDAADKDKGEMAVFLLANGLIDRKIVKRSVMTLPYGSRYQSCNEYVTEALTERLKEKGITKQTDIKRYTDYASRTVWDAIPIVVQAARHGMNYLQALARLFNKQTLPITWTTPTGFIVQQSYYSVEGKRIHLSTNGGIILKKGIPVWQPKEQKRDTIITFQSTDERKINPARQVSGIAPNFIHSLDASHLMMSVRAARDQGINAFALIHDSLGVHAGKTEEFSQIIRDAFCSLYAENDPLGDITTHLLSQLDEKKKAPEIPGKGSLDISDIKEAVYLFS